MANPIYQDITATGDYVFALDFYANPFSAAWEIQLSGGGGTYEFDYTMDPIVQTIGQGYGVSVDPSPEWIAFPNTPAGTTTNQQGDLSSAVVALRLSVSAITGTIRVKILQPFSIN